MSAKNTLKRKRNALPDLLGLVNNLIDKCLNAIQRPGFQASISDLATLIHLRLKLQPPDDTPSKVIWID
jgi:hypothetical protein